MLEIINSDRLEYKLFLSNEKELRQTLKRIMDKKHSTKYIIFEKNFLIIKILIENLIRIMGRNHRYNNKILNLEKKLVLLQQNKKYP